MRSLIRSSVSLAFCFAVFLLPTFAQQKPNILVIFGDDIGQANISRYTHGVVGYMTPNIDRIGEDGFAFTDYYAENSCTAGRSSFITGQSPMRTGLTKVGAPGAPVGLQARDITIAQALKPLGYATGQFGKNHLSASAKDLQSAHGPVRAGGHYFRSIQRLVGEERLPERPGHNSGHGVYRDIQGISAEPGAGEFHD